MKILVVGGGGREHAIIRALKQSPQCTEIWCAPGNGGISYDAHCKAIPATDVDAMVAFFFKNRRNIGGKCSEADSRCLHKHVCNTGMTRQ